MISEFLGEVITKPIARYAFVALAAFIIFKVATGAEDPHKKRWRRVR